jgi:tetratricopeptide (TPR) repeat protein
MRYLSPTLIQIVFVVNLYAQQKNTQGLPKLEADYMAGRYEVVTKTCHEVLTVNPNNAEALLWNGLSWERLARFDKALNSFERLLNCDSTSTIAMFGIARCYSEMGQPRKAIHFYSKLLAKDSTNQGAKIQLARLHKQEGNYTNALLYFYNLSQQDTSNYYFLEQMGDCWQKLNNSYETWEAYNKSFRLNSANLPLAVKILNIGINSGVFPYINLGIATKALQSDSTYLPVIRLVGYLYFRLNDYPKAQEWYNKAYRLGDSTLFSTLKYLGISLFNNGLSYRSAELLAKAFQLDTADRVVNFIYAKALKNMGNYNLAERVMDITERLLYPDSVELSMVLSTKGDITFAANKFDSALSNYRKALDYYPSELRNMYNIATCYQRQNNNAKAIEWHSKYIETCNRKGKLDKKACQFYSSSEYEIKRLRNELFFDDNPDNYHISIDSTGKYKHVKIDSKTKDPKDDRKKVHIRN